MRAIVGLDSHALAGDFGCPFIARIVGGSERTGFRGSLIVEADRTVLPIKSRHHARVLEEHSINLRTRAVRLVEQISAGDSGVEGLRELACSGRAFARALLAGEALEKLDMMHRLSGTLPYAVEAFSTDMYVPWELLYMRDVTSDPVDPEHFLGARWVVARRSDAWEDPPAVGPDPVVLGLFEHDEPSLLDHFNGPAGRGPLAYLRPEILARLDPRMGKVANDTVLVGRWRGASPDIVHIGCHAPEDDEPTIILSDRHAITVDEIVAQVGHVREMPYMVLMACTSGQAPGRGGFGHTGQFIGGGIAGGAVAAELPISVEFAAAATDVIYDGWMRPGGHRSLLRAVVEAKQLALPLADPLLTSLSRLAYSVYMPPQVGGSRP